MVENPDINSRKIKKRGSGELVTGVFSRSAGKTLLTKKPLNRVKPGRFLIYPIHAPTLFPQLRKKEGSKIVSVEKTFYSGPTRRP